MRKGSNAPSVPFVVPPPVSPTVAAAIVALFAWAVIIAARFARAAIIAALLARARDAFIAIDALVAERLV